MILFRFASKFEFSNKNLLFDLFFSRYNAPHPPKINNDEDSHQFYTALLVIYLVNGEEQITLTSNYEKKLVNNMFQVYIEFLFISYFFRFIDLTSTMRGQYLLHGIDEKKPQMTLDIYQTVTNNETGDIDTHTLVMKENGKNKNKNKLLNKLKTLQNSNSNPNINKRKAFISAATSRPSSNPNNDQQSQQEIIIDDNLSPNTLTPNTRTPRSTKTSRLHEKLTEKPKTPEPIKSLMDLEAMPKFQLLHLGPPIDEEKIQRKRTFKLLLPSQEKLKKKSEISYGLISTSRSNVNGTDDVQEVNNSQTSISVPKEKKNLKLSNNLKLPILKRNINF